MDLSFKKIAAAFRKTKTLYVSDLDGTLLNEQSVVSEESENLLNDLVVNHGAMFTVATARTPATVEPLLSGIKTSLPFIVMNGAAMWDAYTHKYVNAVSMRENAVQHICAIYERHGLHPFIYRNHDGVLRAYHNSDLLDTEKEFMKARMNTPYKNFVIGADPYTATGDDALIIFSMNRYDRLQQVNNDIIASKIPCHTVCYHDIFNYEDGILEVYAPGVTKASALTRLKKQVGANRLVVFGDNLNDMEMMRIADHSIAVENAVEDVKKIADEVIGKNTDDGVAKWIQQDIEHYGC